MADSDQWRRRAAVVGGDTLSDRVFAGDGKTVKFNADYHWLEYSQDDAMGDHKVGQELDLNLNLKATDGVSISAGYSVFWPDEVMVNMGRSSTEQWSYVMGNFTF